MTTKTKPTNNLGTLTLKNPVRVIMLPTDVESVIVNYSESSAIQITCGLPEKIRKVKIRRQNKLIKIETPPLLLSVKYCDIPTTKSSLVDNFYIWGYYPKDKKTVWASPYLVSNVYETGRICYGSLRPKDLRAAHNMFWDSPFNGELAGVSEHLFYNPEERYSYSEHPNIDLWNIEKYMKKYQKVVFDQQDWEDYTHKVCGNKFWTSTTTADAVLISKNKELLKQIPKSHRLQQGGQALFIAKAKRYKNFWVINSGTVKFKLPLEAVTAKHSNK